MNYDTFYAGLEVKYKDHIGKIQFICESYVTICISTYDHPSRDVCILVYLSEWEQIHPLKKLEK